MISSNWRNLHSFERDYRLALWVLNRHSSLAPSGVLNGESGKGSKQVSEYKNKCTTDQLNEHELRFNLIKHMTWFIESCDTLLPLFAPTVFEFPLPSSFTGEGVWNKNTNKLNINDIRLCISPEGDNRIRTCKHAN